MRDANKKRPTIFPTVGRSDRSTAYTKAKSFSYRSQFSEIAPRRFDESVTARTFVTPCPICGSPLLGASTLDGITVIACRNSCNPLELVQRVRPLQVGCTELTRAQICALVWAVAQVYWNRRTKRVGVKLPLSAVDLNAARAAVARRHDLDLAAIPLFWFEICNAA